MIVCIPTTPDGQVAPSWGRANRVAIAAVSDAEIADWREFDVGWDRLHDEGTEGGHHARVARFLTENHVDLVVADHMGAPMEQMLERMGIRVQFGAAGDARQAVLAATSLQPPGDSTDRA